jgi:GNAT superfamily N-acetyltransferase
MVEVALATTNEAGIVGKLLWEFNTEFESPTPSAAEFARRFTTLLTREDVLVLLAGTNQDPSGFAYLTLRPTPYYDGKLAQLEELYVRPPLRAQGIGTELLTTGVQEAIVRGACEMHINVDEVDLDTRRFYERHGFINIEPGEDYRMLFYVREF